MLAITKAVEVLKRDGVLLVPTDTNYALAVDPWSIKACEKVYAIKQRDPAKPLTLFLSHPADIWHYVQLSDWQHEKLQLLLKFLPGPLNLVLPKSAQAPDHQYIKEDSISLVCNTQPVLQELLNIWGRPLALTSANISGVEHAHLIDHQLAAMTFGDRVDFILPGGKTPPTTTSSTIISLLDNQLSVLRQGDVRIEDIVV